MFDVVEFGPDEVKAVAAGTADRHTIIAIMTSQTCGEPCWHAHEEVCRCSCGGKNHGCLNRGEQRPQRHAKIDGIPYKLIGAGYSADLRADARRINAAAGYKSLDRPSLIIENRGSLWTPEEIAEAKAAGKEMHWTQYYYTWSETDSGAPARIKPASKAQRANWIELAAWKDSTKCCDHYICLLWERLEMPERPKQLRVDRNGVPIANQNPPE